MGWRNIIVSNAPNVGILSVATRTPLPINGTSTIDLPLCGGAQTLTLTVPQEYFGGAPSVPITDYVWDVPASFTVVSGQQAPGFVANRWLSGRTLQVQVPAGQFSAVVRVVMWSRACNQNPAYNNPPATLISSDRSVTIRRVLPVLTSVTATRTSLTCGDVRPLTFTATASQPGASAFSWSLPAGWSFEPNTPTNTASVSVVPSGAAPTNGGEFFEVSATAFYGCLSYTTPAATSPRILYSNQIPTPKFSEFGDMCLGQTRRFAVEPVVGATTYTWELPAYFPTPSVVTTVPYLDVTAPGTQGSATATIRVSAGAGNCAAGVAEKTVNVGGLLVRIVPPHDLPTELCPNTEVTYHLQEQAPNVPGPRNAIYTWTVDGAVVASGPFTTALTVRSPPAGQWMSVRVDVQDNCSRATFDAVGLQSVSRLSNGQDCVYIDPGRQAPAAYPNPADATLTLRQPAGTQLTIYNAQGRAMYHGKATAQPTPVDTRAWPAGLYYLHTGTGKATQRQQLQIRH